MSFRDRKNTTGDIEKYVASRWDRTYPPDDPACFPSPHAYVTPATSGHLKHLFYWDSYFSAIGLIAQGRMDLARSTLEALVHLFHQIGYVPNVNVEAGANRSQPPFLSHYVRFIYEATGDKEFLAKKITVLKKEYEFWMKERAAPVEGLNKFGHCATDEYLKNFNDTCLCPRLGFQAEVSSDEKLRVGSHYLTEAESGTDFCSRFLGRANDFMAIDLNALLYGYEMNFAWFAQELGQPEKAVFWHKTAARRKQLYSENFWDEERGFFFDYDSINGDHSPVYTPAAFFALWFGLASKEQARRMAESLPRLEADHGIKASDKKHLGMDLQWDEPFGWPPHQYATVHGLLNYGLEADAHRVARKYLDLMLRVFDETGDLWEKYDVVAGSLKSSEYRVETQVGWTAAVFLDFSKMLNPNL